MGHADIRITANIDTHVDNSDVTEAAKLISQGVTQGVTLTAVTIGK